LWFFAATPANVFDGLRPAFGQRELRFLPHAHVAMRKQTGEFLERASLHSLGEEFFRFEHERSDRAPDRDA